MESSKLLLSAAGKCILNEFGYYELRDKPTLEELNSYYADKYYQSSLSTYSTYYSEAELRYFRNKLAQKQIVAERLLGPNSKKLQRFLDIGSGEGWALKFFSEKGWQCKGLDYSSHGCETHNPDCLPALITGDIYVNIEQLISSGELFDLVLLDNVLEHVIDPLALLEKLKRLTTPGGVLIIEVPNDFSSLQVYAFEEGLITRPFWIAVPDHISYFNRDGLRLLAQRAGWHERYVLSDFPIDFNLANKASNYIENSGVGKQCHEQRVILENLMHDISPEKAIKFYEALADMNMGRQITAYFINMENPDE